MLIIHLLSKFFSFGKDEGSIINVDKVVEAEDCACCSGALCFEAAILEVGICFIVTGKYPNLTHWLVRSHSIQLYAACIM